MTQPSRNKKRGAHRKLVTTLGELVAAAYEAVPGLGQERLERARLLLTRSPLARALHPQLQFME